jgi:hypothetical protein
MKDEQKSSCLYLYNVFVYSPPGGVKTRRSLMIKLGMVMQLGVEKQPIHILPQHPYIYSKYEKHTNMVMVFNVTFNNISAISWRSVLLVGETGVPGEKNPTCRKSLTLYHIILYRVHLAWVGFELTTLHVIGTDCIGSCKSNYHAITTTTVPKTY